MGWFENEEKQNFDIRILITHDKNSFKYTRIKITKFSIKLIFINIIGDKIERTLDLVVKKKK